MDSIDSMLREIQDENNAPLNLELVIPKLTDTITQTIEEVIDKANKFICFECGKQFHRYMSYKQHWGRMKRKFIKSLLSFSYHEFSIIFTNRCSRNFNEEIRV